MKKKQYTIKKCLFCGADIFKRQNESIPSYYKRKFCKLSCQHKWNAENKSKNIRCDFCNKEFRRRKSDVKKHNFCCTTCQYKYRTQDRTRITVCAWCGKRFRKKLSDRKTKRVFCSRKCMGEWQAKYAIGEFSYSWQGGISTINSRIRSLVKYRDWVKSVFNRDGYTCQYCGDSKGGNLNAHHKKSVSLIIKENDIKEMIDIIRCKDLWDIKNGITLCKACHTEIHKRKK